MKKAKANGPAIDSKELIEALEELEKERGIKKDIILESIETALVTAYKRNFESSENVKVTMDGKTGETHVYAEKEVVEVVDLPNEAFNEYDLQVRANGTATFIDAEGNTMQQYNGMNANDIASSYSQTSGHTR